MAQQVKAKCNHTGGRSELIEFRLFPEGADQGGATAHAAQGLAGGSAQLAKGNGAKVR